MPKDQSQDRKERKKWKSSHTEEENHLVGLDSYEGKMGSNESG